MTVQFSRSVRSIHADNLGPMLIGTTFFAILMLGWVLWFFFAAIPDYEDSTAATYQREGYVMAEFSALAFNRLQRGQPAQFQPAVEDRIVLTIPLVVTDIYPETSQARLVVRAEDETTLPLQSGLTGQVKVTVEQFSPAVIVLRSAGLLSNS